MGEYASGFKLSIHNEKDVTKDDIINEAQLIWKKVRKEIKSTKIAHGDYEVLKKFNDNLMSDMRKDHKEFCQSYPIVLRYMCEMREFKLSAFKKYLMKIEMHPWKSEEEYLEMQAEYVVILYKETHPKWNKTDVTRLKNNVFKLLKGEHEEFKNRYEDIKKDVETTEEFLRNKSRTELFDFCNLIKDGKAAIIEGFHIETEIKSNNDIDSLINKLSSEMNYEEEQVVAKLSDFLN